MRNYQEVIMENYTDIREQIFHNTIRENVIFLLLFVILYTISFCILGRFRRRDKEEYFSYDDADTTVYNISLWLSSFSLAVATCAALLLPISIVSNEILLLYPDISDGLFNWLNSSLIQGLWNHVFLFSNLSLFILLPFAYLFTESEGFLGSRKGLWARVQETFVVLVLVALVVLGMVYIASAVVDSAESLNVHNVWSYYLPFLYSCISFVGAVLLLLCTPLGIVRLFTLAGQILVKPQFLRNLDEEFTIAKFEENCLRRRLEVAQLSGKTYLTPEPMTPTSYLTTEEPRQRLLSLQNGALQMGLDQMLRNSAQQAGILDMQRHTGSIQRNLVYPICMLLLFVLSALTVLIVLQNSIELLIGMKALPLSTRQFTLGISSLSKLGPLGAALEIILIVYLKITSLVGLYTLPFVSAIEPIKQRTPLTHLIANCVFLLVLSSALPLISRTLGITNFDLLGDFGKIEWLGNFQIVLLYNLLFAAAIALILVTKFTSKVRRDMYVRLKGFLLALVQKEQRPRVATSPGGRSYKQD